MLIIASVLSGCFALDENKPLKVGISPWPGYDIIYYAKTQRWFEKAGLNVKFHRFNNPKDAIRAFRDHKLDLLFTSNFGVLSTLEATVSGKIILVTNISAGSDGIVATEDITSVSELKDKKISAQLGVVSQLILYEALNKHQVPVSAVNIVNVPNDEGKRLLINGELYAAVLWEPDLTETRNQINGNIIHTTKDLDSLVTDVLVVCDKLSRIRQEKVQQFVNVWFQVQDKIVTHPDEVFSEVAVHLGQTGESFKSDYSGLKPGNYELNKQMMLNNKLQESWTTLATLMGIEQMGFISLPATDSDYVANVKR